MEQTVASPTTCQDEVMFHIAQSTCRRRRRRRPLLLQLLLLLANTCSLAQVISFGFFPLNLVAQVFS